MVARIINWTLDFVTKGPPSIGFMVGGIVFIIGLTLGLRSGVWWGWLMALLSLGYLGLKLFSYVGGA